MKEFVCIIGGQRCGSTWLYRMLEAHPELALAKPLWPEPKFFLRDTSSIDKDAYLRKHFTHATMRQVFAEKSTSYIEHPEAIGRIRSFFPGSKAIAILRHPVERALSNYRFSLDHGLETRTLRQVFIEHAAPPKLDISTSVSPFAYLERGHYTQLLKPWHKAYGVSLKIVIFEEIRSDLEILHRLYEWLGLERRVSPAGYAEQVNRSSKPVKREDEREVRDMLKRYFHSHIHQLETWLGRPIPAWHDHI